MSDTTPNNPDLPHIGRAYIRNFDWNLYLKRPAPPGGYTIEVLLTSTNPKKRRFHLQWNGTRLVRNRGAKVLDEHHGDVRDWVVETLRGYHTVTEGQQYERRAERAAQATQVRQDPATDPTPAGRMELEDLANMVEDMRQALVAAVGLPRHLVRPGAAGQQQDPTPAPDAPVTSKPPYKVLQAMPDKARHEALCKISDEILQDMDPEDVFDVLGDVTFAGLVNPRNMEVLERLGLQPKVDEDLFLRWYYVVWHNHIKPHVPAEDLSRVQHLCEIGAGIVQGRTDGVLERLERDRLELLERDRLGTAEEPDLTFLD